MKARWTLSSCNEQLSAQTLHTFHNLQGRGQQPGIHSASHSQPWSSTVMSQHHYHMGTWEGQRRVGEGGWSGGLYQIKRGSGVDLAMTFLISKHICYIEDKNIPLIFH